MDFMQLMNADPAQIAEWAQKMAQVMPPPAIETPNAMPGGGVGMPQSTPGQPFTFQDMMGGPTSPQVMPAAPPPIPQQGAVAPPATPAIPQIGAQRPDFAPMENAQMLGLTPEQQAMLMKQGQSDQAQAPGAPGIMRPGQVTLNPVQLPQSVMAQRLSLAQLLNGR